MMSGRNATTAMMAPSWFCTKKRSLSDFFAGSSRFAFFQRKDPVIDSAAMTTSATMSVMNAHCGNTAVTFCSSRRPVSGLRTSPPSSPTNSR